VSRSLNLTLTAACAAALEVLPAATVVSHSSAAVILGAPLQARWPLHVSVPPGAYRARRRGLRVHVRRLTSEDTTEHRGLPVTSGAQTWLDLAAVLPADELIAVGDSLWRAGHVDGAAVTARIERAGGLRGVVRARACAPLLTPLSASRPESLVRVWLIDAGLPPPRPQVPVLDRGGREVAHADLGWPEWKVAVEYEGRQHADPRQFGRDIDRYSRMAADGWLVVRISGGQLYPAVVVDRATRALRSRGATW
jgi:hypothetical protein